MDSFNIALNTAVSTTTAMIGSVGGKGVAILFATLGVAISVMLISLGFRMGMSALRGKELGYTRWNSKYSQLRKWGYDEDSAADYALDADISKYRR